jgi:GNAT superfamily N-acetyltransferase
MSEAVPIRAAGPGDARACAAIVRALPEHFTDDVPDEVVAHLAAGRGWVALDAAGAVAGFATVVPRTPRSVEITWMAVAPPARGRGVGTALLAEVVRALGEEGVALVEVKTLDASAGSAPYEATRAFWERRGFVLVDVIDPLPGWEEGNPAAIYVRALAVTG